MKETTGMDKTIKRDSKTRRLVQMGVLLLSAVLTHVIIDSIMIDRSNNAPIPFRILFLGLLVLSYILFFNKDSLKCYGLFKPNRWMRFIGMTGLLTILIVILPSITSGILGTFIEIAEADYSHFDNIQGNIRALIYWLILSWVIGGFFEELIFRGYLQTEIAYLLNNKSWGTLIAIISQAIIFALFHQYQGIGGLISTGIVGLITGVFFYVFRNLWILMIAHALLDTLGFIAIYLNGTTNL